MEELRRSRRTSLATHRRDIENSESDIQFHPLSLRLFRTGERHPLFCPLEFDIPLEENDRRRHTSSGRDI